MADPKHQHEDNWTAAGMVGMFDTVQRQRDRQQYRRALLFWTLSIVICLGFPLWMTWGKFQDARRQTLLEEWAARRSAADQLVQSNPAIASTLAKADTLREAAMTKIAAESIADLRQGLSLLVKAQMLEQDIRRLRQLLDPVGQTLLETPWHIAAPQIDQQRLQLIEKQTFVVSLLDQGEVLQAEQELADLLKEISRLLRANVEALLTSRTRQAWVRLQHSVPERLLMNPAWEPIHEVGKDAEIGWETGQWTEARTLYTRATERAEQFLESQLDPEEKARILKSDSETIARLETEKADLMQQRAVLETKINSLNQQLAATNGERQTALTQLKDLTLERDILVQNLASYRERIMQLQTERSEFEYQHLQEEGKIPVAAGIEFVLISPGTFKMGSDSEEADKDERPVHVVTISRPFFAGKHEVTIGQVLRWLNSPDVTLEEEWIHFEHETCPILKVGDQYVLNTSSKYGESEHQPMGRISWYGAVAFCDWCSEQDPRYRYRLPTEAEWEYMARAGTTTDFPWGDTVTPSQANIAEIGGVGKTTQVGSYPPNPWGLHDTAGNVWEWCSDWYSGYYYPKSPQADPMGPPSGVTRVVRSGSCFDDLHNSRSCNRHGYNPKYRGNNFGFRVVAD